YNIKEYQSHGEATLVDLDAVAQEHIRVGRILLLFPPKDHVNFDESSLFAM
ncbi:hypothetical protein PAXRUDRAFT_69559, partial [Paxillus rubicundulus Ve08.2h10]